MAAVPFSCIQGQCFQCSLVLDAAGAPGLVQGPGDLEQDDFCLLASGLSLIKGVGDKQRILGH